MLPACVAQPEEESDLWVESDLWAEDLRVRALRLATSLLPHVHRAPQSATERPQTTIWSIGAAFAHQYV